MQRLFRHHLRDFWPQMRGLRMAGFGFPLPLLKPFLQEAESVSVLMPSPLGAVFWPEDGRGRVAMTETFEWPIETNSIDRLLVIHPAIGSEDMPDFLAEAWRVLKGQGRLLMVMPNRTGIWARSDQTPFGHGEPFSAQQLRHALKRDLFVPEKVTRALFLPPTQSRLLLATAPLWERAGQKLLNAFGGVVMVDASKQLYAGTPVLAQEGQRMRRRRVQAVVRPLSRNSDDL